MGVLVTRSKKPPGRGKPLRFEGEEDMKKSAFSSTLKTAPAVAGAECSTEHR
jgi:hypothetical protein